MFFSTTILAKKGPLALVWTAAHLDKFKKIQRSQIVGADVEKSARIFFFRDVCSLSLVSIENPEIQMAIRLSGHLLVGVCRLYSYKVKFLLHDCEEAVNSISFVCAQVASLIG